MKKKNKNNKNNITAFPFSNPVKQLKEDFKHTIDLMSDDDFVVMMHFLTQSDSDEAFDEEFDEEFWDEANEDFVNPFSGEMVNFKCEKCSEITAIPIEIVNDCYLETHNPSVPCCSCDGTMNAMHYKAPDGILFEL